MASSPAGDNTSDDKGLRLPHNLVTLVDRFSQITVGNSDTTKGDEPHIMCLLMLLACKYDEGDIVQVLSMALANILRQADEFKQMGQRERAFVAAIHVYLAHVFVFDECVPLRYWHDWAFSSYCSYGCLNRALGKLLKLMQYRTIVQPEIVEHNVMFLRGVAESPRAAPLCGKW